MFPDFRILHQDIQERSGSFRRSPRSLLYYFVRRHTPDFFSQRDRHRLSKNQPVSDFQICVHLRRIDFKAAQYLRQVRQRPRG